MRGYQFMTYTIEPIKLLPWLLAEFISLGGKLITKKVMNLGEIAHQFKADLIFNCTGVWASELTKDESMEPLRGQVMRVKAPWIKGIYNRLAQTYCFSIEQGYTATNISSGTVRLPCFAFWSVQPKPLKLASMLIPHIKALTCGY